MRASKVVQYLLRKDLKGEGGRVAEHCAHVLLLSDDVEGLAAYSQCKRVVSATEVKASSREEVL